MADDKIIKIIKRFVAKITSAGYPVEKAVLFGSYARGVAKDESDIDLCLVSKMFGRDEIDEMQFLLREAVKVDDRLEPIPLSVDDYKNDATPLVCEIKKYGIETKI